MKILETDLYALTMAYAYYKSNMHEDVVTFEGFVRRLPEHRNFLVFSGLQPLLNTLANFNVTGNDIAYLKQLEQFRNVDESFWSYLHTLQFTCEVHAPDEGTILFENEPFIRVTGPLVQVQLVETLILNTLNYSTAVSSKAARVRLAAGTKVSLAEFGYRRAAGRDAANTASRAAFIGGFNATSNVEASALSGIPLTGTMAHSFVMSHQTELDAFKNYGEAYSNVTALIDTYDPIQGLNNAITTFGINLKAVRLDSGDKVLLSKQFREILDRNGLNSTQIIVSDDMNEHKIKLNHLMDAPIDGYGVGTEVVSPGPLGGVFKLTCGKNGKLKAKLSENKTTYPGIKQVFRQYDQNGQFVKDVIGFAFENIKGKQLLNKQEVVYRADISLDQAQKTMYADLNSLPKKFHSIDETYTANIEISEMLQESLETLLKERKI